MTPLQRRSITRALNAFDFAGLFTDLGWDWPGSTTPLRVPTTGDFLDLQIIAEKRGVQILLVPPQQDGSIMPSAARKTLEKAVTPLAVEHLLIFTDADKNHQIWLWTSRQPNKPIRHRELFWEKGKSNELLLQKLGDISFTLEEEESLDLFLVTQRLRDNLDRDRLTKKFYTDFKKQKDAFQKFITGINEEGIMAHYTSLMLNRLMFCYFLQQKSFLDGDTHYLRNRLNMVKDAYSHDQFHSFYRSFLQRLFYEGLDSTQRPDELTAIIGKNIPYLNGGIFAEHPIERDHPEIQIPDEAFEKIFTFFDAWQWHLDDRPLGESNQINPEVLGYVFEKYTNQKEMGAYYTKEDITEYISKNTILPFLLNDLSKDIPSEIWHLLAEDPDRYIYEAVRRGAGSSRHEWQASLPEEIAIGLDPEAADFDDLLTRRKDWNTPTATTHSLPTEIWRETIARHQRCHDLRDLLQEGKITNAGDLITHNLDIRQFIEDLIAHAPASLALALWKRLHGWQPSKGQPGKAIPALTVLDPTCGSGAFLFAGLEILQPLYEALLTRLRTLLSDWASSGESHPQWQSQIQTILAAVARHPNESYFIHKTIIVHNLYGVDIMEEAVEICKLRLFLKLAAQLELGQEIEPLPDIDFNIRSGNTLVGYASREEIRRAFTEAGGSGQALLQGIETPLDDYTHIMEQAEDADRAFRRFQEMQDSIGQSANDFRSAKANLETILASLRCQLDRYLAGQYHQKNLTSDAALSKWQKSHEPFHWFVEFYGIMEQGGFDAIIGNPPWNEYSKIKKTYTIRGYITESVGNLYGFCTERCLAIAGVKGLIGFIVQLPLVSSARMAPVRTHLEVSSQNLWFSMFDDRPGKLFDGLQNCRSVIFLAEKGHEICHIHTTAYQRWASRTRSNLLPNLRFSSAIPDEVKIASEIPKIGNITHRAIQRKMDTQKTSVGDWKLSIIYPAFFVLSRISSILD